MSKAVLYLANGSILHVTSHSSHAEGGTIACYCPEEATVHMIRLRMDKHGDWEATSIVKHTFSPSKLISSIRISPSGNTVVVAVPGAMMALEVEEEDQKPIWVKLEHANDGFDSDKLFGTTKDELVRECIRRPRSAFSPVVGGCPTALALWDCMCADSFCLICGGVCAELIPHPTASGSSECFRLLLQNGLLYSLFFSGPSKRRRVAADGHLIIQPTSNSTDARRAIASLQRVDGWAIRPDPHAGGSLDRSNTRRVPCRLVLAARPDDDPAALKINTVKTESCLAMGIESPAEWRIEALVEDVIDALAKGGVTTANRDGNGSEEGRKAAPAPLSPLQRLDPVLLAYATSRPASRAAFRDQLAAALILADQGHYPGVAKWLRGKDRTLLWIATWLHVSLGTMLCLAQLFRC